MKVETAAAALTVDHGFFNYTRIIRFSTANRNCLPSKVDIAVTFAGIYPWLNLNNITVIGIVDCHLDVIEIGRGIIIDGNYSCLRGSDYK